MLFNALARIVLLGGIASLAGCSDSTSKNKSSVSPPQEVASAAPMSSSQGASSASSASTVSPPVTVPSVPVAPPVKPQLSLGRFYSGDFHVHSAISEDAHTPVNKGLGRAFNDYGLDFVFLSDHLRLTGRNNEDESVEKKSAIDAIETYQKPLLADFNNAGKLVVSGVEWNNATYEHTNIWLYSDQPNSQESLQLLREFEYLAQDYDPAMFNAKDVERWAKKSARFNPEEDGLKALQWLNNNIPSQQGLLQLNHPNRKGDTYSISDYRDMLNAAPDFLCAFEGLPGNQATDVRAEYEYEKYNGSLRSFVYAGVDYSVNYVGGEWDTLLSEGYNLYVTSNSDFHDAYAPGEYNKTLVWLDEGETLNAKNIMNAVCNGKTVAMFGNLMSDLNFYAESHIDQKRMGDTLLVEKNKSATIHIRIKPSEGNPYTEKEDLPSPVIDHIDLIGVDMREKILPGTAEYQSLSHSRSAMIYERFFIDQLTLDDDGYYTISFEANNIARDMFFRLRGTNLTIGGDKMDYEGNPNVDFKRGGGASHEDNYNSLWFYSSPIYIEVQ